MLPRALHGFAAASRSRFSSSHRGRPCSTIAAHPRLRRSADAPRLSLFLAAGGEQVVQLVGLLVEHTGAYQDGRRMHSMSIVEVVPCVGGSFDRSDELQADVVHMRSGGGDE